MLPLFGVLAFLAQDRRRRLNSVLELSDAYRGTARLLSSVIGYDDAYTGSHTRGVTDLAAQVADALGLTPTQRRKVEFGAMLHDVGKIAISKTIINKPTLAVGRRVGAHADPHDRGTADARSGRWPDERDRARRALVSRALRRRRLPGRDRRGEIPIEARIVFCCDAFSAMTTDRPYRKAMSDEAAIAELQDNAGTQFDPEVVDALVGILRY